MSTALQKLSSSLLNELQTDDEYKKYFRDTQNKKSLSETKSLSEITLSVNHISLKTIGSDSDRTIFRSFPFAKNKSEDADLFVTEECLDNLLHEIDVINDLQKETGFDEQKETDGVKKHAVARLLLFYRTCAAYYKSKPNHAIRYTGATIQIGKGIKQNDTEACHHAIFCEFENDVYYFAKLREKLKTSIRENDSKTEKKVTNVLRKLLFLGVPGANIEQFLQKQQAGTAPSDRDLDTIFSQDLLKSKLINNSCRLFYQNNHTLVAKGFVNSTDDCIEHKVRYQAIAILNRCANDKEVTPIHATLELAESIAKATAEGYRFLQSQECNTYIDQISHAIPAYTRFIQERTTSENFEKKKEALHNIKKILEPLAANWDLKNLFSSFTHDIKSVLSELKEVFTTSEIHFRAITSLMESHRASKRQHDALQLQIERNQTKIADLENSSPSSLSIDEALALSIMGSKARLAQLKNEENYGTKKREELKTAIESGSNDQVKEKQSQNESNLKRVQDSIALYSTLLHKASRKQPLTAPENAKLMNNFEQGKKEKIQILQNDISEKKKQQADCISQMHQCVSACTQPSLQIDNTLSTLISMLRNLLDGNQLPDRQFPSIQTIDKIKKFLIIQKNETEFLAHKIKQMIAEYPQEDIKAYATTSHLSAIRRSIKLA